MQYDTSRSSLGEFSFLTSVEKKRMKDGDKEAKIEDWNLGNF